MGGVLLDLLSQAVDVDHHGGVVPHGVVPPDPLVQGLLGKDDVGVGQEEEEALILLVLQGHLCPVHEDPAGVLLEQDAAQLELVPVHAPGLLQPVILGQVSLDPGHQHTGGEGAW